MIKRYIKTDNKKIIDIFHEGQEEKFDGSEIYLDTVEAPSVWINGKGLFDEAGKPIFKLKNNGEIEEISNDEDVLEYWKKRKDKEIRDAFEEEFVSGAFRSAVLGIIVDARRSDTRNDIQNVRELINQMQADGISSISYTGKNEDAPATIAYLEHLALEMVRRTNSLYQRKKAKQTAIKAATTKQQVKEIKWND